MIFPCHGRIRVFPEGNGFSQHPADDFRRFLQCYGLLSRFQDNIDFIYSSPVIENHYVFDLYAPLFQLPPETLLFLR